MRFTRTTITALLAVAALGALAAVALASSGSPTTTAPAPTAETDPPAQVRTETVHRTVHVNAPARSASSDDDGTLDQGPGDAPRTPAAPAQGTVRHDAGDDRRGRDGDDDNSGPGSSHSGHDGGDDHGGHSGHGGGDDD